MKSQISNVKSQNLIKVPIEVSARHIHLSQKDLDNLFGVGYKLRTFKALSQPGEFASRETISIIGPKNKITNVRIIGPVRNKTQLEITITDSFILGTNPPPILVSGSLDKSHGGVKIVGPRGRIDLKNGVIASQRHLHISLEEAKKHGLELKHHATVSIKTTGVRSVIFNNVVVRSKPNINKTSFQLDTDEANAAGIENGDMGEIIK